MNIKKTLKSTVFILINCFFLCSCLMGQSKQTSKTTETKPSNATLPPSVNEILKKQILLTNSALFSNNRSLEGASGFLIKQNGSIFAITARHLLGEDGGIRPEIDVNDLSKSLIKWQMMPRVIHNSANEIIKLEANGLDFSESFNDILLLKVLTKDFEIETLIPNFDLPSIGETLFLIGCPYSERKCQQNVYPVRYSEFRIRENSLVFETDPNVDLRGFSGAPLVNSKGEVVGILTSSFINHGKEYSMATHIKAIQKIKF